MVDILLIRTGKTDFDTQGRIQGTIDLPLSEEGLREMAAVSEQLAGQVVEALYAGPESSTRQTAELVAGPLHQKVKSNKQLRNLDLGLWQGMLVDDVKHKQPRIYRQWLEHPETVCPPQGEMLQEAEDRLREVLAKIAKKHKSGTVALVLSEPMACLCNHVLRNAEFGNLWQPCCQERPAWEWIPGTPQVALANGTPQAE